MFILPKNGSPGSPDSANFFGFSAKYKADNAEPIQFALCRDSAANFQLIMAKNLKKHPQISNFLSKCANFS